MRLAAASRFRPRASRRGALMATLMSQGCGQRELFRISVLIKRFARYFDVRHLCRRRYAEALRRRASKLSPDNKPRSSSCLRTESMSARPTRSAGLYSRNIITVFEGACSNPMCEPGTTISAKSSSRRRRRNAANERVLFRMMNVPPQLSQNRVLVPSKALHRRAVEDIAARNANR